MKIAIVTPILFDKTSPFNHLFSDIIKGFLKNGYSIERHIAVEDKNDNGNTLGINVENIKYHTYKRKRAAKSNIIFRYVFDTLTTIRMAFGIMKSNAEVLFEDVCYSSFWSVKMAKMKGMRVVAMVQDIWPDNAVVSGIISKGSFLYNFFEMWQKSVYKDADTIICISEDMKKYIADKGISQEKIIVIHNWGYTDEIVDIPNEENEFIKKFNLNQDVFYAVYAGNIGRMQNVELIVESAKLLKDCETIKFLIIGDGVNREEIEKMVAEENLTNVEMLPMQPSSLATHIYSAAGINIIPLVKGGVDTALPSKTGVVLSCGKETAFCFGEDCEFSSLLKAYSLNPSISSDKPEDLAEYIKNTAMKGNHKQENCYKLFKAEFTRTENVKKYVMVIEQ